MLCEIETARYRLFYDARYGVGYIARREGGAESALITGTEMTELRRQLNRARTNATSKRRPCRPFDEIAEAILSEYVIEPRMAGGES